MERVTPRGHELRVAALVIGSETRGGGVINRNHGEETELFHCNIVAHAEVARTRDNVNGRTLNGS